MPVHITTIAAMLLITGAVLFKWHTRPTLNRAASGLLLGLPFAIVEVAFTCILSTEGNNSIIPAFTWLTASALMLGMPSRKLAAAVTCVLTLFWVAIGFHHAVLANSPGFTDSPKDRLHIIANRNKRLMRDGKTPGPAVSIHAEWHTGFTRLYRVTPPGPRYY